MEEDKVVNPFRNRFNTLRTKVISQKISNLALYIFCTSEAKRILGINCKRLGVKINNKAWQLEEIKRNSMVYISYIPYTNLRSIRQLVENKTNIKKSFKKARVIR